MVRQICIYFNTVTLSPMKYIHNCILHGILTNMSFMGGHITYMWYGVNPAWHCIEHPAIDCDENSWIFLDTEDLKLPFTNYSSN
jgi:hypothetical protein